MSDPAPQAVYQTFRSGNNFSYDLSGLTPSTDYTVRLHFARWLVQCGRAAAVRREHQRQPVLTDFDIYAEAGGEDKAVVKPFTATADANGQITVTFSNGLRRHPQINGIEVLSLPDGTPVEQVNCGLLSGGTIAVNPNGFTNDGTIAPATAEPERQWAERAMWERWCFRAAGTVCRWPAPATSSTRA